ncbi:uncharacterized protein LOC123301275 [Chrysoperla carnea]|uniref:uncharacterized protein LOC123301275 n=1 Tax=Chrysoperla carnea TaxID=189513 RepID=UPI001D066706|nr:uncharacterized protein LOC123301275 [Chrysoperla carnea]
MEFFKKRVLLYGKKSSVHGLRYLVDENNSYLIKIFWLIPIILSSIGSTYIFIRSYEAYVYNSISFVTETTYLNWNTSFPAVSICEVWYKNKYWERLDKYNLTSKSTLQEYLSETVFFTGQCYTCDKLRDCPDCDRYINLTKNLKEFRYKCEEIFVKCLWNDEPFNCCDQFLPLETEYGICYTINSLHTR